MGGNFKGSDALSLAALGTNELASQSLSFISGNRAARKDAKKQIGTQARQAGQNIRRRQNLLEQQLAERRARLGSLGITGSRSADAVSARLIGDAAEDITSINEDYYDQAKQINRRNKNRMQQDLLALGTTAAKMIL